MTDAVAIASEDPMGAAMTLMADLTKALGEEGEGLTTADLVNLLHDHGWARPSSTDRDDEAAIRADGRWLQRTDIVGLAEITELGEFTTEGGKPAKQVVERRLKRPGAPEPVRLMMGPVWNVQEALPFALKPGVRGRKEGDRSSDVLDRLRPVLAQPARRRRGSKRIS